jgi:predicted metal-binding membrane protein
MPTLTGARGDPAVAVWVGAGACWLLTTWLVVTGGHELGHHDVVLEQSTWPWPVRIAGFLAVWLVMIGAMMLPTVVPLVRLFAAVSARAPHPARAMAALGAGYVAVWVAFAPLALLGDAGVHAVVDGNPVGFLWQHYGRGTTAAWLVGVRHGLSCLGCCWALMLVMFGTGVGSLVWMLVLTAVMVVEKTTRWGDRIAGPVGVALLIAGVTVAVLPNGVVP